MKPRVLDLFSGCGGISCGMERAGFEIAGHLEFNPKPSQAHAQNFGGEAKTHDITQENARDWLHKTGPVDIIVGGPPCQSFSRAGRSKLIKQHGHNAHLRDPRGQLAWHYLRFIETYKPRALLMENVPDILNHGQRNVALDVITSLEELGYDARYTVLNAAHYGVPQFRERMFILAYLKSEKVEISFPTPTHQGKIPTGYIETRRAEMLLHADNVRLNPPLPPKDALPFVTVQEALSGLPVATPKGEEATNRYQGKAQTEYDHLMRTWTGLEQRTIYNLQERFYPRDSPIFALMEEGDQYPQAYHKAQQRFEKYLGELTHPPESNSEEWKALRKKMIPPFDPNKFPSKWRKLRANQPSHTLTAHLGKDGYSHLHFAEARSITIREAARLQSFPDAFKFPSTIGSAMQMIGNAVPPLMAYALGKHIYHTLYHQKEKG